MKSALLY